MKIKNMIEQINESGLYKLDNPIYMGILPNNGQIIDGFPQAIMTFANDKFIIYTFKGIRKYTFKNELYEFNFSDITEIEMGKYNFKNHYIKINFSEETFVAFQYFKTLKEFENQEENLAKFIKKLESIATVIED